MSKYWDINVILRYQRRFNFINGKRSIGKTYTTQKFLLDRALKKRKQFIYIVRTQDEKKRGIMKEAFDKVTDNEFPEINFEYEAGTYYKVIEGEDKIKTKIPLGYCIALSEAVKIKKLSFPDVYYMMMDEYMLEGTHAKMYVNGWNEPDLLLSLYHTVDRETDRVIVFMLGNNTAFYNPYHMHDAFRIPNIEPGEIWTSENVLFQWAVSSEELEEEKSKCKFLRMIANTKYGQYAKDGNYVGDNSNFIEQRTQKSKHLFIISYTGRDYGVWFDSSNNLVFIDTAVDPSCNLRYAFTLDDHSENTVLTKSKSYSNLIWLSLHFKRGNVRFVNMDVKIRVENALKMLL